MHVVIIVPFKGDFIIIDKRKLTCFSSENLFVIEYLEDE